MSPGCTAAQFYRDRCIGHVEDRVFSEVMAEIGEGPLDARGAQLSGDRLGLLIAALTPPESVRYVASENAPGAQFPAEARFDAATFSGDVSFNGAQFRDEVRFAGATFLGEVHFDRATFHRHADFDAISVAGNATFEQATFRDHCGFEDAQFKGHAGFESANFENSVDFRAARFLRRVRFTQSTFAFPCEVGPMVVDELAVFDRCTFRERVQISVSANGFTASGAGFGQGARLRVCRADIALDGADFARASALAHLTPCDLGRQSTDEDNDHDPSGHRCVRPRLMTLSGAQVAELSLSGIDLSACRFFGAHGLGSMNIEASCKWATSPKRWWIVDREVIVEELEKRGGRWCEESPRPSPVEALSSQLPELTWRQLAGVYRELRRAREEAKDQAGAGDHYYGEMAMRFKHARRVRSASMFGELVVLALYWLLSGYGLRASRAFIALVLVLVLATLGLRCGGFSAPVTTTSTFAVQMLAAAQAC